MFGGIVLAASLVVPQTAAIPTAPVAVAAPAFLPLGTEVPLRLMRTLTTKGKHLAIGDRFELRASAPVVFNGVTVIPQGSVATGEVNFVKNKGMWGKSGRFTASILYVMVGDRQIKLNGNFDDKGTTGTAGVIGAVALAPVMGFFMTGTSATVEEGTIITAFTDEPVPVTPAP